MASTLARVTPSKDTGMDTCPCHPGCQFVLCERMSRLPEQHGAGSRAGEEDRDRVVADADDVDGSFTGLAADGQAQAERRLVASAAERLEHHRKVGRVKRRQP